MFIVPGAEPNQELWRSGTSVPSKTGECFAPTELIPSRQPGAIDISSLERLKRDPIMSNSFVSQMQMIDRKGNQAAPLASAICWKCCKNKKL